MKRPESEVSRRGAGSPSTAGQAEAPLTFRYAAIAVAVGLVAIVLTAVAVRYIELVSGQYVSTAVPPLPAFAVLLIFSLMRSLLSHRFPRLVPSRAQGLLIYAMLTLAVILNGLYHVRGFLPHLVALQYWGRPESRLGGLGLGQYVHHLPRWYAPQDIQAVVDYYEGTGHGVIPWQAWFMPLFWWSLFFVAVFCGVFSLVILVRRQWIQHEKLSFPLLTIPLALTSGDWSSFGSVRSRRSLFGIGFGIALAFNGLNILHVLYPSVPGIGFSFSLSPFFPNRPWTPFGSVQFYYMLEAIGIGYFMPLEITFSIWFFYLLNRLIAVAGTAAGYDVPGFPFTQDQSMGGYLAVGLFLIWGMRRTLATSLRESFRRGRISPGFAAGRWAWAGLIASALFVLGFCSVAGLSLKLAIPFFIVIGIITLVYARIRAESGIPFQFIHPYGVPHEFVLNVISVPKAIQWGGAGSFVLYFTFGWMSTHNDPMEQTAYQLDSVKLAKESSIPLRTLFLAILIAFIVGLVAAYWSHLGAYYTQGSNLTPSAGGIGEYREMQARGEYQKMHSLLAMPPPRNTPALVASLGGFCLAFSLAWLRRHWLGCPFHPLGFLIANATGDSCTSLFAMFVAWLLKALVLKVGGLRYYRQGIPFFLGLAIGHFLIGGIFWPIFALSLTKEAANSYHLLFGD